MPDTIDLKAKNLEFTYPAVSAAFEFVVPSYQQLLSRFEAADNRLSTILTVASSLTLAAPVLGRAIDSTIQFGGKFYAGVLLFAVLVIVGIYGRATGRLMLVNPGVLFQGTLHESEWEFKKNSIHVAGQHFRHNADAIQRKSTFATVTMALFVAETLFFALWIVS